MEPYHQLLNPPNPIFLSQTQPLLSCRLPLHRLLPRWSLSTRRLAYHFRLAAATTIAALRSTPCFPKHNTLSFHSLHNASLPTSEPAKHYPRCGVEYSEYTPCEDRERSLNYSRSRMIYRERHCPEKKELLKCRIPAPFGYKIPFPWPESRDVVWYANVHHRELTVEKAGRMGPVRG
ncbi:probable methyltransferase PMT15 [Neltuma alba]|uniref:probable methyltransferase PMT15 n=1 Tax=Neltuma alba TaxID=207710 RepID=UPI0010A42EEF|nr:probable methyltransferase PMT15 [Prosopis alba]